MNRRSFMQSLVAAVMVSVAPAFAVREPRQIKWASSGDVDEFTQELRSMLTDPQREVIAHIEQGWNVVNVAGLRRIGVIQ